MPVPLDRIRWNVRKATLIDVPAVARLIEPLTPASGHPDPAFTSATRLVLAHVGLAAGEFWVAADDDGDVRAAAVLLPPRQDAAGHNTASSVDGIHGDRPVRAGLSPSDGVAMALRLHLGGANLIDLDAMAGVPQAHWLLVAVAAEGAEPVLSALLAKALPAVDAAGLSVLNVHPGRATQALLEAGFQPWTTSAEIPMLMRPAAADVSSVLTVPEVLAAPKTLALLS